MEVCCVELEGLEATAMQCGAVVVGVCVDEGWCGGCAGSTSFMVFGGEVKDLRVICNTVFMEIYSQYSHLRRCNIYGW